MIKSVKAAITCTETGEIRVYDAGSFTHEMDTLVFLWTNGNYGCDCNRELFFARAGGDTDPDFESAKCSDSRYSVKLEADGRIVWDDKDPK